MRSCTLAPKQGTAQIRLEQLNGLDQRRRTHVATLGGPRKVEGRHNRQKVADLMHFHAFELSLMCRATLAAG